MAASYLIHHPSGYIFRYCIPTDIQKILRKRELRYSLKTGSLRRARSRAHEMVGYVSAVVDDIREGQLVNITTDQINIQIRSRLRDIIRQAHKGTRSGMDVMLGGSGGVKSGPRLSEVLKRHVTDAKKAPAVVTQDHPGGHILHCVVYPGCG